MECVFGASRKGAASAMENLYLSVIPLETIVIKRWRCLVQQVMLLQQRRRSSFLLALNCRPQLWISGLTLEHLSTIRVCVINYRTRASFDLVRLISEC
jgi:hypothetical protein